MSTISIHTSDRALFKRCRRKWGWSSLLRDSYQPKENAAPLWLGTGLHYAMEDFHGYNRNGRPGEAFKAFVKAYRKSPSGKRLPIEWPELMQLGIEMCMYYETWLQGRDPLKTLWINGVPQVEVQFKIPIPVNQELIDKFNSSRPEDSQVTGVVYAGTIDRVIEDDDGRLWLLDYKTAKTFGTAHYETDAQVSAYCWAGSVLFDRPIAGFIYQQHKKTLPDRPRALKNGTFSTAQNQSTTRALYRQALIEKYGSVQQAPADNVTFLNKLAMEESTEGDKYIQRDRIYRNEYQAMSEGAKILLEAEDMLNPDLPLYPNPTRDCSWDCPYQGACVMLDSGADFMGELEMVAEKVNGRDESWRNYL